jgi:hypothetical protein
MSIKRSKHFLCSSRLSVATAMHSSQNFEVDSGPGGILLYIKVTVDNFDILSARRKSSCKGSPSALRRSLMYRI